MRWFGALFLALGLGVLAFGAMVVTLEHRRIENAVTRDTWDDIGSTASVGDVKVTMIAAKQNTYTVVEKYSRDEVQMDAAMTVHLRIENLSSTRKVDYFGWGDDDADYQAKCSDEHGNRYFNRSQSTLYTALGNITFEPIHPGQSVEDKLIFERLVDAADEIRLTLPARNVGERGTIRLRAILRRPPAAKAD